MQGRDNSRYIQWLRIRSCKNSLGLPHQGSIFRRFSFLECHVWPHKIPHQAGKRTPAQDGRKIVVSKENKMAEYSSKSICLRGSIKFGEIFVDSYFLPNSGYLLNRFYKSLSSAPAPKHEICQICPTPPGCNDTSLHLAWMEGLQVFLRSLATFSNLQRVNLEDSDKSSYHRLYYYNLAFFSIQISFSHQKSRQQQQVGGVLKTKQLGKDFQVCWCSGFVEFLRSLPSVDTAILIQPPMARSRQLAFLRWV